MLDYFVILEVLRIYFIWVRFAALISYILMILSRFESLRQHNSNIFFVDSFSKFRYKQQMQTFFNLIGYAIGVIWEILNVLYLITLVAAFMGPFVWVIWNYSLITFLPLKHLPLFHAMILVWLYQFLHFYGMKRLEVRYVPFVQVPMAPVNNEEISSEKPE